MENTIINETLEGLLNTINYTSDAPQALVDMGQYRSTLLKRFKNQCG